MFFTYILLSLKDNRTYVGYTNDLEERLARHNSGQVTATQNRRPLKVFFHEEWPTMEEAKKRELYWKSGAGRRKLKKMFEEKI
ncbi:GIY-YIG nuclease family protein [Candidatus Uhrbacteria bacterium]|nr:GIY-YIG nuclease family protein [Candidatus Uhrbacteria bacterium]